VRDAESGPFIGADGEGGKRGGDGRADGHGGEGLEPCGQDEGYSCGSDHFGSDEESGGFAGDVFAELSTEVGANDERPREKGSLRGDQLAPVPEAGEPAEQIDGSSGDEPRWAEARGVPIDFSALFNNLPEDDSENDDQEESFEKLDPVDPRSRGTVGHCGGA